MKLRKVKPSTIKVPELRVTARFDEETRKILRDSIREVGIIAPILCQEIDGEMVLVDGLHRMEDSIAAGDQPVDVAVLEGDMVDLLCRNLFLDHARGKTPVSEMVKVIASLYQDHKLDPDKIREKTGLTRDYVEKLIKISTASPSVQDSLDQGIIGVGHAYELSRLPYAIQQDEIIAKHQVYRYTVKELHEQIDGILEQMEAIKHEPAPVTPAAGRLPTAYYCEGCKAQTEPRYLRPVMLCPNCFGEVWRLGKTRSSQELGAGENGLPP